MASKVSAQHFIQQETGCLIDKSGNKLQAKSMVMCQSIPYMITEEGNIDHFIGGKVTNIYHVDDRVLTGSRWRTRCRQFTGIPSMPITSDLTPVTDMEVIPVMTPPVPSETEQIEPTQSVPVPLVEAQTQPDINNRLGGSSIMEPQVTQIENISCNNSFSSSDSLTQEYLKNHFNEQLNVKVYNTFKELFQSINIDSMKEALPKASIYNSIILKFIENINSKYGMALMFTTLEPHEVGDWAKTFQLASGSNHAPKSPRPQQV